MHMSAKAARTGSTSRTLLMCCWHSQLNGFGIAWSRPVLLRAQLEIKIFDCTPDACPPVRPLSPANDCVNPLLCAEMMSIRFMSAAYAYAD